MTDKYRATNLAIVGAYITEGLFSPTGGDNSERRRSLLEFSPSGHIGIIADVCRYTEYMLNLVEAAHAVTKDYPGVWEYEVVDYFGTWYGDRLIESGHIGPTPDQVRLHLINATWKFFTQCGPVDEDALAEAIFDTPFFEE